MNLRRSIWVTLLILGCTILLLSTVVSCTSQDGTVEPSETPPVQLPPADSSPSSSPTDDVGQETIRLTNGEWPPYLSENLEHYGVVSHIVTEAFALEGVKVEYGFFPWIRAYELAKSGEWDGSLIWLHTPEREQYFYFSEPILQCNYVFWHLKNYDFDWDSIEDLQDVTIGGTRGYFYEDIFSSLEKAGKVKVEWVSQDEQNFMKLLAGRIDLYVQDVNVSYSMLQNNFTPEERELITYQPKSVRTDDMCLILSRKVDKNEDMLVLFNKRLQRLRESGKIDRYLAETLGGEERIE